MTRWNSTLPAPSSPMKRTKPLNKVSKAQRRKNHYLAVQKQIAFAMSDGRCVINAPGCTGTAMDPHHRRSQAQGGSDHHSNLAPACRKCHSFAHRNVAEAVARGWIEQGRSGK